MLNTLSDWKEFIQPYKEGSSRPVFPDEYRIVRINCEIGMPERFLEIPYICSRAELSSNLVVELMYRHLIEPELTDEEYKIQVALGAADPLFRRFRIKTADNS